MVRVEDNGVSQTPSPSQSQRAWSVALGSGSVEEDASNATELFTLGYGGGEGEGAPSVRGAERRTGGGADRANAPVVVGRPLIYGGAQGGGSPAGAGPAGRARVPRNPPLA